VESKILNSVKQLAESYNGKSIVLTNGCFDLLHVGHIRYLAAAKKLGDILVVGLNSDASVKTLKGAGRPINSEADRAEVLSALAMVDHVIIFPEKRATRLVRDLRPQVYAKGGDYTVESLDPEEVAALQEVGARIEILPLTPGKSTTNLIKASRER
jgi:rfaE bifunctional protein nucleotidyltransferase chain/domain